MLIRKCNKCGAKISSCMGFINAGDFLKRKNTSEGYAENAFQELTLRMYYYRLI